MSRSGSRYVANAIGTALATLILVTPARAQQQARGRAVVTGHVTEAESGRPVADAAITIEGTTLRAVTDSAGRYRLAGAPPGPQVLAARRLGFAPARAPFSAPSTGTVILDIALATSSLRLPTVVTTADAAGRARGELGTASVIDREAIAAQTAASLAGILELVPGVPLSPPGLDGVQQFSLRSVPTSGGGSSGGATGPGDIASFGTLIILDGVPLSNNANLQSTGPRGEIGFASSAGGGIDLRRIPATTIERVEVVRAIPSARWGDLTNGAIVVDTRAGQFAPELLARYDPRTLELSAAGGTRIGGRQLLAITGDVTRTRTAPSLSDAQSYRLSSQLSHRATLLGPAPGDTSELAEGRLSLDTRLDFYQLLDDRPEVPDVARGRASRSRDAGIRALERATLGMGDAGRLQFTGALSNTRQRSFVQALRLRPTIPFTDRLDAGRSTGRFIAGEYSARVDVEGDVWMLYGRGEWERLGRWLGVDHLLRAGGEMRREWNDGPGYQFDIEFPPQVAFNGVQGFDRPRRYDAVPPLIASALYVDDRLTGALGDVAYDVQVGLRFDLLHGAGEPRDAALQPRLNAQLAPRPWLRLRGGVGTTAKLPAVGSLYPAPQYFDVVNVNWFVPDPAERLAVLTTFVRDPTNPDLRMTTARKLEAGVEIDVAPRAIISLTAFDDRVRDVVGVARTPSSLGREYFALTDSSIGTGHPPGYVTPAERIDTVPILLDRPANNLALDSRGLELTTSLPEIRAIHTRLDVQAAWIETRLVTDALTFHDFSDFQLNATRARTPYWSSAERTGRRALATYRIIHHRPELGLVVTTTIQHALHESRRDVGATDTLAYEGYLRRDGTLVPVPPEERGLPANADLRIARSGLSNTRFETPPDWFLSLQVAKSIPLGGRLSFYAFNALDRQGQFRAGTNVLPRVWSPVRYGLELTAPLAALGAWRR